MAIEVTKVGRLPEEKRYRFTCSHCRTEFTASMRDGNVRTSGYNESSLYVLCPLNGCGREASVVV